MALKLPPQFFIFIEKKKHSLWNYGEVNLNALSFTEKLKAKLLRK